MKESMRKQTTPKPQASKLPPPNLMEAAEKVAEAAFGISPSAKELGEALYDFEVEVRKDEAKKHQ